VAVAICCDCSSSGGRGTVTFCSITRQLEVISNDVILTFLRRLGASFKILHDKVFANVYIDAYSSRAVDAVSGVLCISSSSADIITNAAFSLGFGRVVVHRKHLGHAFEILFEIKGNRVSIVAHDINHWNLIEQWTYRSNEPANGFAFAIIATIRITTAVAICRCWTYRRGSNTRGTWGSTR
jgi:hypothetical protein